MWIGERNSKVTSLFTILSFPLTWSLCCILSGLRHQHTLISNDLRIVAIRSLDTLGSVNTHLSWLTLWASLWTLIYITSLFTTPKANPIGKGY
jgi:hypothetical protein